MIIYFNYSYEVPEGTRYIVNHYGEAFELGKYGWTALLYLGRSDSHNAALGKWRAYVQTNYLKIGKV